MSLILHDTLVTSPLVLPIVDGWADSSVVVERLTAVAAAAVGPADFALAPSSEATLLSATHEIDPELGVVSMGSGAIAMRSPIRADDVDTAEIVLYETSGTAELLARATLWPFYGIRAKHWVREPNTEATVFIVEGEVALEPLEAGFSEDLVRAWFILTEQPVVTHVLLIPVESNEAERVAVKETLRQSLSIGWERRREVRQIVSDRSRIPKEQLFDLFEHQRYSLNEQDRISLQSLAYRGAGGSGYPAKDKLRWRVSDVAETSRTG